MTIASAENKIRCDWVNDNKLYIQYHDEEWGVPVRDDKILFEFLILEGMQAGLSWLTVLKKREHYRQQLDQFDPQKIAYYSKQKIHQLLANPNLIRNRLKINSIITNAQAYLKLTEKYNSFTDFIWGYVNHKPIQNQWLSIQEVPTSSEVSEIMSKDLKKLSFKFVGSTICYAYMQAVGLTNDHLTTCFRHSECQSKMSD